MTKVPLKRGIAIVLFCFGANVLSHMDRQIIIGIVDLLRHEMDLSDTQIGVLHGLAFSLTFAVFGVVLANLGDRFARGKLIALAIGVWSISTAAFGLVSGFMSMFLARMGVGLGQAMLSPLVYSLLADNFHRKYLGRACATYAIGSFIGVGLVLWVGGRLLELAAAGIAVELPVIGFVSAWRAGLVFAGVIGLVYAVVVAVFVTDHSRADTGSAPAFFQVLNFIGVHRQIYFRHFAGFSLYAICLFTLIAWGPTYFLRIGGYSPQQVSVNLALGFAIANVSGVIMSGLAIDFLRKLSISAAPLRVASCAAIATGLVMIAFTLTEGVLSASAFFLATHLSCYAIAPAATVVQALTPQKMRVRVYAIFLSFNSLIGMSLGPAVVGLLNDFVFRDSFAVGQSMVIVVATSALLAGAILTSGGKHYAAVLKTAREVGA